jgi:hypothetical protein
LRVVDPTPAPHERRRNAAGKGRPRMSDFSILYPLAGFTLIAAFAIVAW